MEENTTTRGLGWSDRLGMVDTIFEEEEEESEDSLSSHAYSSPSTPDLFSSVESWSQVTGKKPDVKIYVDGECFCLHKDLLASKSGYLQRRLQEVSELSLSPPLKVTVDAFKIFAEFCYQCDVVVTPFNLASLRTAVELLQITADGLRQKVESYFSHVVAEKRELSAAVFLSSLSLLPEAEDLAFLPSRCLESLCSLEDSDGGVEGVPGCAECVKAVQPAEFQIIADSMQRRLTRGHDLLYKIVDLYLKVYEGKMEEEQKTRICNSIDCNMLSPQLLMHAVQNPRMPLRFIVQAMLIEQLNTHRSIFWHQDRPVNQEIDDAGKLSPDATTLGALLQPDAALRQVTQLRAAIDTTTSRIQNLEKELSHMKARLIGSEKQGNDMNAGNLSCRSVSCRFSSKRSNKVERGERGSISSTNLQYNALPTVGNEEDTLERSLNNENSTSRNKKKFGNWLITGLKSAFGVSSSGSKKDLNKDRGHTILNDIGMNSIPSSHNRSHSLS
ncbi:hypothetical protein V2J09_021601 [Rumex salicifolius]